MVRGMMGFEFTRERASALSTPSLLVVVHSERVDHRVETLATATSGSRSKGRRKRLAGEGGR